MDRLACYECRQCNHKGRPSVTRFSNYCDAHYVGRVKVKKGFFSWLTKTVEKLFEKLRNMMKKGI